MIRTWLLAFVCLAATSGAQADTIVIGAPGDAGTGSCYPFGCTDYVVAGSPDDRYQQVYASSEFSAPITIYGIEFYKEQVVPFGSGELSPQILNSGSYQLSLSTTSVAVNALDPTNFDANLGSDVQLFTTAALSGGVAPETLTFWGDPFTYDPSLGNLLLDIQITDPAWNGDWPDEFYAFYDARIQTSGGAFSAAHNFAETPAAVDDFGLVTGFVDQPIPEPSSAILFCIGALVLRAGQKRQVIAG